jgi:hypothetical protein
VLYTPLGKYTCVQCTAVSHFGRYKQTRGREGEDRKAIAHGEREPSPFLVLYDVKHLRSGCRSIATEDSCE